tara:strand:- start:139 stop:267 length:129 start_codon:yes stop_codon:yes gene_type:complete
MENSKDGVVEQTEFQGEFVHGHFHSGVDAVERAISPLSNCSN